MTDSRHRQPASDEASHAIPKNAAILAASRKRAMPEPPHLEAKEPQRRLVHGYTVIADVSTHHRLQPLAQCGDGFMHAPPKFGFHRIQFCLQPFANRLPQHRVHSVASLLYADMRKAEEVECFRPPFTTPLPVIDRKPTKLQQPCFLGMQFQMELPHSFPSKSMQNWKQHSIRCRKNKRSPATSGRVGDDYLRVGLENSYRAEFFIKRGVRTPKALRHLLAEARISRESLN